MPVCAVVRRAASQVRQHEAASRPFRSNWHGYTRQPRRVATGSARRAKWAPTRAAQAVTGEQDRSPTESAQTIAALCAAPAPAACSTALQRRARLGTVAQLSGFRTTAAARDLYVPLACTDRKGRPPQRLRSNVTVPRSEVRFAVVRYRRGSVGRRGRAGGCRPAAAVGFRYRRAQASSELAARLPCGHGTAATAMSWVRHAAGAAGGARSPSCAPAPSSAAGSCALAVAARRSSARSANSQRAALRCLPAARPAAAASRRFGHLYRASCFLTN